MPLFKLSCGYVVLVSLPSLSKLLIHLSLKCFLIYCFDYEKYVAEGTVIGPVPLP